MSIFTKFHANVINSYQKVSLKSKHESCGGTRENIRGITKVRRLHFLGLQTFVPNHMTVYPIWILISNVEMIQSEPSGGGQSD